MCFETAEHTHNISKIIGRKLFGIRNVQRCCHLSCSPSLPHLLRKLGYTGSLYRYRVPNGGGERWRRVSWIPLGEPFPVIEKNTSAFYLLEMLWVFFIFIMSCMTVNRQGIVQKLSLCRIFVLLSIRSILAVDSTLNDRVLLLSLSKDSSQANHTMILL